MECKECSSTFDKLSLLSMFLVVVAKEQIAVGTFLGICDSNDDEESGTEPRLELNWLPMVPLS